MYVCKFFNSAYNSTSKYYIISCRLVFKFVVYAYRVRQVGLKSTRISEQNLLLDELKWNHCWVLDIELKGGYVEK